MGRIERKFEELKGKGEGALITYAMAGDPDEGRCLEYVRALEEGGADLLELGVPFSDPTADGPVIQKAETRALRAGIDVAKTVEMVGEVRKFSQIPVVLMGYYNPFFRFGESELVQRCVEAGVDGLLIPDLPLEEAAHLLELCRSEPLELIFLATPETDRVRFSRLAEATGGFIYLVGRYGTTGARDELSSYTEGVVRRFGPLVAEELPLVVGFGLSKEEHINRVIEAGARGAVVGSALVDLIGQGAAPEALREKTEKLKRGTRL